MSVESMTELSWVMYGISGAFAVAAVVLFFVLDIAKCWRMVSGRRAVRRAERRQAERAVPGGGAATINLETERLGLEDLETRNLYIEKSDIGEPGVENLYKEEPDQGGMETQALHKEDTGTERLVIEGLRTKKQTGEQCTFEWVTEKLSAFGSGEPDRENALPDRAKDHAQEGAQTANFEIIQDIVYVQETAPAI